MAVLTGYSDLIQYQVEVNRPALEDLEAPPGQFIKYKPGAATYEVSFTSGGGMVDDHVQQRIKALMKGLPDRPSAIDLLKMLLEFTETEIPAA